MLKKIYLASPYGFSEGGEHFMFNVIVPALKKTGFIVLNPWDSLKSTSREIQKASKTQSISELKRRLREINRELAKMNVVSIRKSDIVVAVLDGQDVDSGVAAEIGYAYALQKKIIGYRSDFRLASDNLGGIINLQVQWFIENSGGIIVTSLEELLRNLRRMNNSIKRGKE